MPNESKKQKNWISIQKWQITAKFKVLGHRKKAVGNIKSINIKSIATARDFFVVVVVRLFVEWQHHNNDRTYQRALKILHCRNKIANVGVAAQNFKHTHKMKRKQKMYEKFLMK